MRGSFVLALVGFLFGFITGVGIVIFGQVLGGLSASFGGSGQNVLWTYGGALAVGSVLGLVGGAIGKKVGGIVMIVGGLVALIGASLFGLLPCILFIVGGAVAIREKPTITMQVPLAVQVSNNNSSSQNANRFCTSCGKTLGSEVQFCGACGAKA